MQINSDINIIGGLTDWNLIKVFLTEDNNSINEKGGVHAFTAIKTDKSVNRYEKAIRTTLLSSKRLDLEIIIKQAIHKSGVNKDTLLLLFWNASSNNDLLFHLNDNVFFPAFYSGRVSIKSDEVVACLNELKQTEDTLKKWSDITVSTTASKYLTLLKKFGLMEGAANKRIVYPYLNDAMFILFAYWLSAISEKPNLVTSHWLHYCFSEKQAFLDRLLQKKFSKYFNMIFTGDKLNIEPIIPYELIYEQITKS